MAKTTERLRCIDVKYVRDWIPESKRRGLDLYNAWAVIRRFYCTRLVMNGVCPIECEQCKARVLSMFELNDAKNAMALFTWMVKDRSAKAIEELRVKPKKVEVPISERLFGSVEQNPFDAFLEGL